MSSESGANRKRYYAIMIGLVILGAMTYIFKTEIAPDQKREVQQIKEALVNVSLNQQIGFSNQKVIAKGINDLGAIVSGDIRDIKEKTNLLDEIKFNTEQILNKTTLANVTLDNTRLANVNLSLTSTLNPIQTPTVDKSPPTDSNVTLP